MITEINALFEATEQEEGNADKTLGAVAAQLLEQQPLKIPRKKGPNDFPAMVNGQSWLGESQASFFGALRGPSAHFLSVDVLPAAKLRNHRARVRCRADTLFSGVRYAAFPREFAWPCFAVDRLIAFVDATLLPRELGTLIAKDGALWIPVLNAT